MQISIHAPRVGSDFVNVYNNVAPVIFQSTLPVWGATDSGLCAGREHGQFQSTLPVWGATQERLSAKLAELFQSTLPVWGATWSAMTSLCLVKFQSTLPVWGATLTVVIVLAWEMISIHAPRVGSDVPEGERRNHKCNFNPRSPCGERQPSVPVFSNSIKFQSTLPVWGATLVHQKEEDK